MFLEAGVSTCCISYFSLWVSVKCINLVGLFAVFVHIECGSHALNIKKEPASILSKCISGVALVTSDWGVENKSKHALLKRGSLNIGYAPFSGDSTK